MTDDVSIYAGGQKISGWTRVRITRGIERMPADFEVELTEYYSGDNSSVTIVPGSLCQVYIDSDIVITGYVDSYESRIDGTSHIVNIAGRSKSADLVDCSAEWPNAQIMSAPVLQIVQNLAAAYKINVSQNVITPQNVIPQINLMYGETAVEIIERICRFSQLLFYDLPDGSILLTTASSQKAASGFAECVNVQSASSRFTMTRYQTYTCVYQAVVSLSDGQSQNSGQNNSMNQFYTEVDNTVPRNRKKYIVVESGDYGNYPVTRARAQWEHNRRYGKAFEARIVTDRWRDVSGKLWTPNTLADLALPTLKIPKSTWLISEVTYSRDNSGGTTASLVLNPPQAFVPEPIVLVPQPFAEGAQNTNAPQIQTPPTISDSQLVTPTLEQAAAALPPGVLK